MFWATSQRRRSPAWPNTTRIRSAAAPVDVSPAPPFSVPARPAPAANHYMLPQPPIRLSHTPLSLLNESQPAQALEQLQAALPRHPQDPNIPDAGRIGGLSLGSTARCARLLEAIARSPAQRNAERHVPGRPARSRGRSKRRKSSSARTLRLRYEGEALPVGHGARPILAMLDDDYSRISTQLGWQLR